MTQSEVYFRAQALYEAGCITYMRTDRPVLGDTAAEVAERAVRDVFGAEYVRQDEPASFLSLGRCSNSVRGSASPSIVSLDASLVQRPGESSPPPRAPPI